MNSMNAGASEAVGIDAGVLAKVRGLLAKAESTTFPAEAEALTAKAHQLIARYSIDCALLEERSAVSEVLSRTLAVEAPYARAKFHLLGQVASACRCRGLWQVDLGVATIFGFAGDLDATELLYTSLLVQATTAMLGSPAPRNAAPSTVAAFRRAFLYGFANRVGQRLREIAAAEVDAAIDVGRDESLLPVLASRDEAVAAALTAAFPGARAMRLSVSDAQGWRAGVVAADRARLTNQRSVDGRRAIANGNGG
jgi:hypothetical protein